MTDLSAIPSEVFLQVDGNPLDVRLQMLANGYELIPVSGCLLERSHKDR